MGYWGPHPWQNDPALDWLDKFAEQAQLNQQIETALRLPLEEIDEIRAAAHLLLTLSSSDVQFIQDSTSLMKLAQERLLEAIQTGVMGNRQFILQMLGEIVALKSAVAGQCSTGKHSDTSSVDVVAAAKEHGLTLFAVADVDGEIPESQAEEVVGTGFLDGKGGIRVQIEDERLNGFHLKFRLAPSDDREFPAENLPTQHVSE